VLLCCLLENWMQEGELQCGCPHITPHPCGEEGLRVEPSWEAYIASSVSSLWRLSRRNTFRWIAAGLGWWAASVVTSPFQYVRWLYSVRWYIDLSAAHDSCERFVSPAITLCVLLFGVSRTRRVVSFRRNTWVESRRYLWMNVAGDAWRVAGVGGSWTIWRRSCCMRVNDSTFGAAGNRSSPGTRRVSHRRRALLRKTASTPCRRCVCRIGPLAGPRSTVRLHDT